jgi:alpha-L-fucosidase
MKLQQLITYTYEKEKNTNQEITKMKTHSNVMSMILFIVLTITFYSCSAQILTDYPLFPADHAENIEWWKDARFGMFIHWGPVSLNGTEIGHSRGREISIEKYDSL